MKQNSTDNITIIIVDSDALIAQLNKADPNHSRAAKISKKLVKIEANLIFPLTTIVETISVLKFRKKDRTAIKKLIDSVSHNKLTVSEITLDIFKEAVALFDPESSKRNTFFDAIIAASAKKENADAIFSFDKWYSKLGFQLVEEII